MLKGEADAQRTSGFALDGRRYRSLLSVIVGPPPPHSLGGVARAIAAEPTCLC